VGGGVHSTIIQQQSLWTVRYCMVCIRCVCVLAREQHLGHVMGGVYCVQAAPCAYLVRRHPIGVFYKLIRLAQLGQALVQRACDSSSSSKGGG
jgi:hypothetical protein